jgi:hypothetical protein
MLEVLGMGFGPRVTRGYKKGLPDFTSLIANSYHGLPHDCTRRWKGNIGLCCLLAAINVYRNGIQIIPQEIIQYSAKASSG